jgi:hypothetical protein
MKKRLLLPCALLFVTATAARTAYADISIGAEVGAIYTTQGSSDDHFGFGFAGRLGWDIDLSVLHLIPEIKVAYDRMPLDVQTTLTRSDEQTNVLRPMVGLRATIGIAVIAIVGFAHVGYAAPLGASEQLDANGLVYELGGGIDFTSIPVIDIGIWGAFNQTRSGDRYDWVSFGAQVTITI